MKSTTLLLLMLFSTVANANWELLLSTQEYDTYRWAFTKSREGDLAYTVMAINYKKEWIKFGSSYRSERIFMQYHCKERASRRMLTSFHESPMGEGKIVYLDEPKKVPSWDPTPNHPNSLAMINWACGNR
jgi:hypothetical protein